MMRISYVEYEVDRDVGAEKLEIDSNLGFIRLQWVWDTQNTNVGSSKHVSIKCLIFKNFFITFRIFLQGF